MGRRALLAAIVVSVGWLVPAGTAGSAEQSTECTLSMRIVLVPGLSQKPTSGSFYSRDGETGTAECDGPVKGRQPTGPGTVDIAGRYGTDGPATCSSGGKGWGVHSMTFPTADGNVHLENTWTMTYGGLERGAVSGTFDGDYFSGTFEVRPTKGDCVSAPITEMTAVAKGRIHDFRNR